MLTTGLEELEVQMFEYAFLLEKTHHTSQTLKLNIPKVMPLIPRGTPVRNTVTFNNNIFVNDAKCKPRVNKSVQTQNYLTQSRFANTNFEHKVGDKYGYMYPGNKFIMVAMEKNIRDIYITDNI